jgi:molybdenum cofactor cytidylyltransferase
MPRLASLCGVILSAGASSRMGRDKALLPWPPMKDQRPAGAPTETFLAAAIRSFLPHTELVIVVVGENAPNVAPILYGEGASMVRNPDPQRGQFSSLQVGLREVLNRGRDAALVTLVDRPPVSSSTIEMLRQIFVAAPGDTWAVVPEYQGRHGHPFLVAREMIEAFLKAPIDATARDVEHSHQRHITYVPVSDPLVTQNIDTPEDYAALTARFWPS